MLPRGFGDQKGVVARRPPRGQQKIMRFKNPDRGNLSYVAIICDDTSIQPVLPQILLGNEHVLRVQDLEAVKASLPSNVYLIRAKSGWVENCLFALILKWLRAAVSQIDPNIQILLLLDTSFVHLHPHVFRTAKAQRIRLRFVPASCTWLLQPCDTHLFRKFKAQLAKAFRRYQVENSSTQVPMPALIHMITTLIRQVVQGTKWVISFENNGYDLNQSRVSERVLVNLEMDVKQRCTSVFPSLEKVLQFLPAGRAIQTDFLKHFALETMLYTPKSTTSSRPGADGIEGGSPERKGSASEVARDFVCSSLCAESQSNWDNRLRRLPSRTGNRNTVATSSQEVESLQSSLTPASRSAACPSWTRQAQRDCEVQHRDVRTMRPAGMLKACAMAMARPRK